MEHHSFHNFGSRKGSSCGSVHVSNFNFNGGQDVPCGGSAIIHEMEGVCATITGRTFVFIPPNNPFTPCDGVLEFETCDGHVIRKAVPNPAPGESNSSSPYFTIACVKRIVFRCRSTDGGDFCRFTFSYGISYCDSTCKKSDC